MAEEQKFRTSVFGGFDKKNVVQYITDMVEKFNCEIDSLKKEHENQIEQKDAEISDYESKYKRSLIQIQNLKNKIAKNEENYQEIIDDKIRLLDSKENTICKMNKKINNMENKINELKTEDEKIENKIKQAEMVAKDRVNKIVKHAKRKIEEEYREHVELADKESRSLRKKAREEASRVLKNAADRAYRITMDSKEETQRLVEAAQSKADGIIAAANIVVEKMLKNSARAVIEGVEEYNVGEVNVNFDVDFLKEKIDNDVSDAVKKLDGEDRKNNNDCGINSDLKNRAIASYAKKYKKAVNDVLKSKNKD